MFKFIKKANDNINIYNININFFVYFKNIKPNFKKIVSTFLSCSILYSQLLFSFIITQSIAQSIISTISIKKAYAFNDIIPPQNIKDNPVDHIAPDNSVNVPGGNNTHLDRTQNGTPMVNINNANADGISANYYKDFNVNDQNLILNNYKGEATNTQLGGAIYGNPNFNNPNGREADIILNEITTNRVSNIDGYVEVAGRRADIIIANPNGIMVGGAGFININRLSMITGKSLDGTNKSSFNQNGELNLFLLTDTDKNPNAIIQVVGRNITDNQGNIVAYNLGIDAQDVRYADLVSRVVKINGNIHGSNNTEVNIKTGNDKAYYNTDKDGNKNNKGFNVESTINSQLSTVNSEAEASNRPEFAIDSTAFGGIYTGRINFIATEEGVGVRTRSDLVASTDDLNFDINGNIILEDTGSLYAKNNINLNNKNNNSSESNSQNTHRQVINKSTIASENNINITTDELINKNEPTTPNQTQNTQPQSQTSKIYALNNINIINTKLIDNSNNGHINAGNDLNIDSNDYLNNQSGQILSGNNLTIKSNHIDNTNGNGTYTNGGYIFANNNIDLINLNNNYGTIESNGNITITNTAETSKNNQEFQKLNNEYGLILSINSNKNNKGNNSNNSKITIITTNSLNNSNGNIKSNGDIDINILTDYIINGALYSNSNININAKDITNLSDIISGKSITLTANNGNIYNGSETNSNANIIAMNDIIFNILKEGNDGGNLYNYGTISANNNININAEDSIYNGLAMGSSARISSNNNVTLIANNKIINKGYIQTTGNNPDSRLILETRAEINSNYKLANYDLERLNDGSMDSLTDEYLKSLRINSINTNLTEKTGIHNYGRIYSNTDMELNSNSILHNNKGALIYSNNDIFFNINKVLFNNENNLGQGIYANNNIDIFGYTSDSYLENLINYDGRIESKSDINIKTNNLINYGSDNYDLSNIDTEPNVELYKYSYGGLLGRPTTNIFGAYGVDNSKIPTGAYQILSNYYGEQDAAFNGKLLEYEEYAVVSNVISNPSAIRSGNSLNIDNKNNLINKNSSINSKDIDIETNNLLNYLTSFIVTTHSRYNERGYFCGGKCNVDTKYYTNNILYSQTPSEIIASGDLNVKAKNLKGGGTIEKQDLENLEGQNLVVAKQETKFEEISKTGTLNPLDNAQLPEGDYGIFRKPQNPNSHYLFETDPTLIDISKFLGSEYFMNRLGLDPNSVDLKFIGDSYFEHDLLKRTLENLSNTNSALKSTPSEEITDRINQMYENIDQDLQNRLGLKFGESLTEEQLANLDRDIIWYVKQDIALPDGTIVKDVLVPQIYLSKNNRELLEQNINILNSTGSIIAGTNINLNIENNLTNSNNSTIVANNNLNINAGNDINNLNGSTIKTLNESGILQLIAGNDINNIGANISAQNDLSISAGNDINNITLTQRNYDGKNSENSKMSYHDSILNESTIESKNHAIISAKNNINIQGASTQSENDLYINAENGNINISTAQLESFSEQKSGDGGDTYHKMNQAIKNKESNIASKNGTTHLQASGTDSTNGNINIIGSNIYGEDGVNLIADNNVNVLSSVDMEHSYLRQKEENWDGSGSIDINQTITNTNNSSNIVSNNGNINIITGRNTNIVASNLATNESGDINILAGYTVDKDTGNIAQKTDKDGNITTGSINILSTQDLEKNYSYHEEWGGFFDMLANFDIDLDKGGLTLSTSYEQELDENTTLTKTARTSNINANNGSINLNATENILSIGTQIYADKDISLNAGYTDKDGNKHDGNIILASADNSQTIDSKHEETIVTVGVKIGNSYVDTANTIANVANYNDALKDAKKERDRIRELYDQGKASEQALDDADGNVKVAEANLAYGILQSLAAIASSAQTASTSFGTGFYANAFANYDTTTTTSNEQSTWQTQGNIQSGNGNINFNSTNDMTQEGTNVYALNENGTGTITYNIGNNLTIQASKDTYNYNSKTETTHAGISVGTKINNDFTANGANGGLNIGGGKSSSKINSESYNNSEVIANNINIKTGNDTNIKGANIEATNDINMNIANNLNIESLQDTYYANTKDNSWNAGISYSNSGSTEDPKTSNKSSYGINGGGSSTHSNIDSKWVNNQTSITANNNVNINTNNNTDIKGGLIASNSDNLNINTGSLTYSDINNFNTTTTKGSGLSTGIGTSTDNFFKGTSPNGTTTITNINEGQEKEGTTKATIGKGNITIAGNEVSKTNNNLDLIRDLNRDTNNTQQITKDMITGAANNTLEIDNRVFTPSGWKSIYSDVRNAPGNLLSATAGAMSEAEEIAEFGREKLEKIPGAGLIVSQPFSAVEGFFDYFVENDSKAYVYDEKNGYKETNSIKEGKNYYTNGIMNRVEYDISDYLFKNQDSVVRYNPTSGFTGDLMESTLGKLFNWNGLTAQLGSMNRTIANDLTVRKDMQYSSNNFHSQGTINGTGAMNILARNGIKLNDTQSLNAKGPAVYNRTWDNTASQVLDRKTYVAANDGGLGKKGDVLYSNITYSHNEKDPVRYLTAPRTPWDPFLGLLYGITNMKEHNIGSYK